MKLYISGVLSFLLLFISCRREKPLEVDFELSVDKSLYQVDETVELTYHIKGNQDVLYADAKILDENNIAITNVVNHSFFGEEVEGTMSFTFLNENLQDGVFTLKFSVGNGEDEVSSYLDINVDGVERELSAIVISETTLGDSYLHLMDINDGLSTLRIEQYPMDIMAVNSAAQNIIYTINNNQELKSFSATGSYLANQTNNLNPADGYFFDGVAEGNNIHVGSYDGMIYGFNNGSLTQARDLSSTHIFKKVESVSNRLVVYEEPAAGGINNQISVYFISNGIREQVYSLSETISSSFSDGENYAWFVGENVLYQFDLQNYTFETLNVGTDIDRVIGVREGNLVLTTPTGYLLYDANLESYSSFELAYHNLYYEPMNDYLVRANGGTLSVVQFATHSEVTSTSYSGSIADIEFLYNF